MDYYVYILASRKNGTLYIGVTNNLIRRMYEHKEGKIKGFTKKYGVQHLVYREKQLKNWKRDWKVKLIETENPNWNDLSIDFL